MSVNETIWSTQNLIHFIDFLENNKIVSVKVIIICNTNFTLF